MGNLRACPLYNGRDCERYENPDDCPDEFGRDVDGTLLIYCPCEPAEDPRPSACITSGVVCDDCHIGCCGSEDSA
jgi:hypothetical protein